MTTKQLIRTHGLWILWLIATFILLGIPGTFIPKVPNIVELFSPDKIVHLIIFGGFVFLLTKAFIFQYPNVNKKKIIRICLVVGIFIGALSEVMQHYVFVGRNGNYVDFLADLIGCFVGMGVYLIQNRKK
jgi:VanZ family protein